MRVYEAHGCVYMGRYTSFPLSSTSLSPRPLSNIPPVPASLVTEAKGSSSSKQTVSFY